MTDEHKAERRRVVTNNKAWEVATPVRREYVTELLARRSVPKGTLRYVTDAIMADPAGISAGDGDRVASLIGKETHPGAWDRTAAITLARDASDARLPLVLLAQVAASVEARFGERQGWRHPTPALVDYLRFLTTCGYGLSEVEREVADGSEATSRESRFAIGNTLARAGAVARHRAVFKSAARAAESRPAGSPARNSPQAKTSPPFNRIGCGVCGGSSFNGLTEL
jgi:hypothetical protein